MNHHGNHVVCFYFSSNNRKIKTQQQYWIDGNIETISTIEELLGKGTVRIG
jgi:hypothetical protein